MSDQRMSESAASGKPRADLPTIERESQHYWDAASAGTLLIARCDSCGTVHHYPRPFCPSCWSENVAPIEASGRGTLYTYSTVYVNDLPPFAERLPYVAAVVELEEGPRLMTNIEGCDTKDLAIGMSVHVDFRALTPEINATVFRPATR